MKITTWAVTGTLVVALGACAPPRADSEAPVAAGGSTAAAGAAPASIVLERGRCFGSCPEYRLELRDDGEVVFDGKSGRVVMGRQTARVQPADVSRLLEQLARSGFDSLNTDFTEKSAACRPYAADAPTVILTVRRGATDRSIRHDHGCAGAPAILNVLEQAVDSVGDVRRWLQPNGGGGK